MHIIDILKYKTTSLSFEFFPPKTKEKENVLFETIKNLTKFKPNFASVTYSPSGISKINTISWTKTIKHFFNIESMMHITCIASTKENVDSILSDLENLGIDNVLALRGDIPADINKEQLPLNFKYAKDLIKYIKKYRKFCIGCAGYPEGHIESKDLVQGIEHLREKIDAGANFIITQLFFENKNFYNYYNLIQKKGIEAPVITGIMPITSINQILKFTEMCGATIPSELLKTMEGKSDKDIFNIGVDFSIKQVIDLVNNGFTKFHFYTLNNSKAVEMILNSVSSFLQT
jgi:methylenetetrahydrofolate reductase (NADPH)